MVKITGQFQVFRLDANAALDQLNPLGGGMFTRQRHKQMNFGLINLSFWPEVDRGGKEWRGGDRPNIQRVQRAF